MLAQIDAVPIPKGGSPARFEMLRSELKRLVILRSDGKHISAAPGNSKDAVDDLAAVSNSGGTVASVTWTEKLWGDFNDDGVVDGYDLQPVHDYYGEFTNVGAYDGHRLVNGDDNPEIFITDIQAIAANMDAQIDGYRVYRGRWNGSTVDWESSYRPNPNTSNTNWSADRPTISPPLRASRQRAPRARGEHRRDSTGATAPARL